ncbi:MAG: UDP-glucose 4-epimerase, UDP-glucose 4-epimerase [Candidatus Peregrinibacteria bacterium GW2011_GWC2_33_13]|nr:MAG: UDP-glucose 4-epimerase, UDP-glucose 4-epimerase [Candidatus Peregrinibacteria bacterium GW2011_GWC2_33_13]
MKEVLITGISGFLGKNIAVKLKKLGYNICGIDIIGLNDDLGFDNIITAEVNLDNLKTLNKEFDYIIHCAGGSTVSESIKNPYLEFNKTVFSSINLLEYARIYNPDTMIIYPSSAAVYGANCTDLIPINAQLNPISPYGYYKKNVEDLCESYNKNYGLKISIIRFFSLYGENLKKQLLWDACNKVYNQQNSQVEFFGTGNEIRDWLNINDACELIYKIMLNEKHSFSIYNGGTGKGVAVKNLLSLLIQNFNNPPKIEFNNLTKEGDPKSLIADISKNNEINWHPQVILEKGLQNYVEWFKNASK